MVFSSDFLYGPFLFIFISTSSVICLLVALLQEGIHLDKDCGNLVDTDVYSFFF